MDFEIAFLNRIAESGNHAAQYNLAVCYNIGRGTPVNLQRAFEWYMKAAEGGIADAQYNLANFYSQGQGTCADYRKAVQWYTRAADNGIVEAQFSLGTYYLTGKGGRVDFKEAYKWYKMAAEAGDTAAQFNIGNMHFLGKGVPVDYEKALKWYTMSAEGGNIRAKVNMAHCYFTAKGTDEDPKLGLEWYTKAAAQGDRKAQCTLGDCFYYGKGVQIDYQKANECYTKAAVRGYHEAQYRLAINCQTGKGTPAHYQKAFEWFKRAVEGDIPAAQFDLALCYLHGKGTKIDYPKAIPWLRKSAEHGYLKAQYALASCYSSGTGTPTNWSAAVKWLKKAAEGGHFLAQDELRQIHLHKSMPLPKEPEQRIDSGNEHIDLFIQSTQYIKWIPYEKIENAEFKFKGGFGSIYKAILSLDGDQHVALKYVDNSADIDAKFLQEARQHLQLVSENVIHIYGITKEPVKGDYAMVMEWLDGGDLRKNLHHLYTYADLYITIKRIALGLTSMHAANLCHKDLHPGNILLKEEGHLPFISDLGLSGPITQPQDEVFGVLPYIPSETLQGEPYTPAGDIYSLGMIIWALLCRIDPFSDMDWDDESDLFWDKKEGKGIEPEIPDWVPHWLCELMKMCWHTDKEMRPTATDIVQLLDSIPGQHQETIPVVELPELCERRSSISYKTSS